MITCCECETGLHGLSKSRDNFFDSHTAYNTSRDLQFTENYYVLFLHKCRYTCTYCGPAIEDITWYFLLFTQDTKTAKKINLNIDLDRNRLSSSNIVLSFWPKGPTGVKSRSVGGIRGIA
jgi:hypothetical protein